MKMSRFCKVEIAILRTFLGSRVVPPSAPSFCLHVFHFCEWMFKYAHFRIIFVFHLSHLPIQKLVPYYENTQGIPAAAGARGRSVAAGTRGGACCGRYAGGACCGRDVRNERPAAAGTRKSSAVADLPPLRPAIAARLPSLRPAAAAATRRSS